MIDTPNDTSSAYRIGAVARLTGISPDTLRMWERRYAVVEPRRTPKGGRLYSQQDVTRLTMIKTLVDQGHAISTVANLPLDLLQRNLVGSSVYKLGVRGLSCAAMRCAPVHEKRGDPGCPKPQSSKPSLAPYPPAGLAA